MININIKTPILNLTKPHIQDLRKETRLRQ